MIRTPIRLTTALFAVAVLTLAACGDDSTDTTTASGTRTVEIEMRDSTFAPDEVQVKAGDTVRFVFHNRGAVVHDAFIGDAAAQDEHEMEMRGADDSDSGMGHGGGEASGEDGITVEPGETGEFTHTFREGDELLMGCHQAGHYEAGMRVTLNMG